MKKDEKDESKLIRNIETYITSNVLLGLLGVIFIIVSVAWWDVSDKIRTDHSEVSVKIKDNSKDIKKNTEQINKLEGVAIERNKRLDNIEKRIESGFNEMKNNIRDIQADIKELIKLQHKDK